MVGHWFHMQTFYISMHVRSSNTYACPPWPQLYSDCSSGLKKRMNSMSHNAVPSRIPIFLQQGSAIPPDNIFAGTSMIDKYARILFPLSFAAFNLVYWIVYLTKDNMEPSRYCDSLFDQSLFCIEPRIIRLSHKASQLTLFRGGKCMQCGKNRKIIP